MKFFFSRIFPIIFIAAGAITIFFGINGLIRAEASLDWPNTQGIVLKSSVGSHTKSGTNGVRSTTYHAEILYRFSVDGKIFKGDTIASGDFGSNDQAHARRVVTNYPKGKSITVYYMAENPKECLLEPGLKLQAWFTPGLGLVFLLVGSLMALFLPKMIRKQNIIE